jgi:hypothetical protein
MAIGERADTNPRVPPYPSVTAYELPATAGAGGAADDQIRSQDHLPGCRSPLIQAVIGGTSFNGGVGTVWGTIVGALILGIINNGLDLMNVSPFMQMVVKGVIIVIAIIMDERKNR